MDRATLKESRIHGHALYPLSIYPIDCPADQPLLDLHWHDELELLLVTSGQAVFRVDVTDYEVSAGEAIFVASGDLHSGYVKGEAACAFVAVVFHPDLLGGGTIDLTQEQYIQPVVRKKWAVPVHLKREDPLAADILDMTEQLIELNTDRPPVYELTTRGLLLIMMAKLYRLGTPATGERSRPHSDDYRIERLKTVLHYIHEHYAEPVKLGDLAAQVAMSEAYFCRFFKSITAKSPLEYVNQYRVRQAAVLLRETDKKTMEIALDVGFNNLSYFIGVFKQHFGMTPAAYRKRQQEREPSTP
ncbi:AraC family transcriptional regulator [Paenibacillus methanolicus]|uniref:AraC-like DNA-binding protein n=1 Tax=Paenibacillus methanolicus TaxID=582686 RepID=A0A5S5CHD4_9BACL|nr:AraC family transcriptional regulator [Paenibacillus methanolicus]TYP78018.1 AraC-like DNA-binding protein [Paenibacillus methanolicus]